MASLEPKYRRLTRARPRARFSVISSDSSSLWLGPDHLLCIDSNIFSEKYKRFYFRDIQALTIRKTDGYKHWALALGAIGVCVALLTAAVGGGAGRTVLFSVAGFFWLLMLFNLALGPTSRCFLKTAVQLEELPSLHRLRRARKILGQLRPLLAAEQGQVNPEEIATRWQAAFPQPTPQAPAPRYVVDDPKAPPRIIS